MKLPADLPRHLALWPAGSIAVFSLINLVAIGSLTRYTMTTSPSQRAAGRAIAIHKQVETTASPEESTIMFTWMYMHDHPAFPPITAARPTAQQGYEKGYAQGLATADVLSHNGGFSAITQPLY